MITIEDVVDGATKVVSWKIGDGLGLGDGLIGI